MTMPMRERMARAMYRRNAMCEQAVDADNRPIGEPAPVPWESLPEVGAELQEEFLLDADAVLEAMEEATEGMLGEAWIKRSAADSMLTPQQVAKVIWQAMIAAAREGK